jgi:hypothetical protein
MHAAYAQATSKPQVLRILEYYTQQVVTPYTLSSGLGHVGIEDQKGTRS